MPDFLFGALIGLAIGVGGALCGVLLEDWLHRKQGGTQ